MEEQVEMQLRRASVAADINILVTTKMKTHAIKFCPIVIIQYLRADAVSSEEPLKSL
jgi:hypothetical protein